MSVTEIQTPADQLAAASDALSHAERKYDAVLADFKKQTTTGSAGMDAAIRKATEEHLTPGVRAAETEVMGVANDVTATARELLARGQNPRITIDPQDEIRAGASYERIRDRVKNATFEVLVASTRVAIDADDRASMLNLYEALLPRLDADASRLSPREKEARLELRALRNDIFEAMKDRSVDEYADDAVDLIERASDLRRRAGKFAREKAPKRRYAFQTDADVDMSALR